MALKVVPAGDERCDIHNARRPPEYICKSCMQDLELEPARTAGVRRGAIRRARRALRRGPVRETRHAIRRVRSGGARGTLIGSGVGLLIAVIVVIVLLATSGGGGGSQNGPRSAAEVAETLGLSPDPSGNGWITLDGACAVISIDIGGRAQPGNQNVNPSIEAANEDGTVRAVVVRNDYSVSQTACVGRIRTALRDHF